MTRRRLIDPKTNVQAIVYAPPPPPQRKTFKFALARQKRSFTSVMYVETCTLSLQTPCFSTSFKYRNKLRPPLRRS